MLKSINFVTIASDASCGDSTTGFAYYIRDDSGTTKHAWRSDYPTSSAKAEVVAAINALRVVSKRQYNGKTKIIYYCDNMTTIRILTDDFNKKTRQKYQYVIKLVQDLIGDMMIDARHVPAHTNQNEQKRFYLNRWCDFNSRAMMKYNRLHIDTFKRIKVKG